MPSHIDLHCHSTVSDGTLAPAALVRHAHLQGVKVLALTDHDDVRGLDEARDVATGLGMRLIDGVEISVTWNKRTLHIVGLKIAPDFEPLVAGLASIREGRHLRAEGMAEGLSKIGIGGSLQGAYAHVGEGGLISRTHFARFLMEHGYAKDTRSVFKNYLVKGKPGYFEHRWANIEDAMSWILESGGIPVLAHPGRYDLGRTNMLKLLSEFREMGGKAIEVVTGSHTKDQYQEFARLAHQFDLLASVGSDYHGAAHSYMEMGRLPELPAGCVPVWHDWVETADLH